MISLLPLRASPLALLTKPESMPPLTYGRVRVASDREMPSSEPVTRRVPASASPVPTIFGSGGSSAAKRKLDSVTFLTEVAYCAGDHETLAVIRL